MICKLFDAAFSISSATHIFNDALRLEKQQGSWIWRSWILPFLKVEPQIHSIFPLLTFCSFGQKMTFWISFQKHGIPVPVTPKAPWSMDANLMHIRWDLTLTSINIHIYPLHPHTSLIFPHLYYMAHIWRSSERVTFLNDIRIRVT